MKIVKFIFLTILLLLSFVVAFVILYNPNEPIDENDLTFNTFEIESGSSPSSVITTLKESGYIKNGRYAKKQLGDREVYANIYGISKSMSTTEILDIISSPISNASDTIGCSVVVPEGISIYEIATSVSECTTFGLDEILEFWSNVDVLNTIINEYWFVGEEVLNSELLYPLEGYIAPATFIITEDMDLEAITRMFLDASANYFSEFEKLEFPDNYTFSEILTLASIIERETKNAEDKPIVSGVFYNRIHSNMPLQSDITVLYAMQEHKEHVLYTDLEIDSPFNTYLNQGLTPGPISNASTASIQAAISPSDTEYYYFFADQETAEVYYAKTYEEHLKIAEEHEWE